MSRRFAWLPAVALLWFWASPAGAAPAARAWHRVTWGTAQGLRPVAGPRGGLAGARALPAAAGRRAAGVVRLSGAKQGSLSDVSVLSATDAWAAGQFCASGCGTAAEVDDTLIMHWNGTAWSQVASPSPSASFNELYEVSAAAANDVWAVGFYCASGCVTASSVWDTLILHWNGTAWSQVRSPSPSATFSFLYGVSPVSATSAWAVGQYCLSGCNTAAEVFDTLILHWNGTAWSRVTSPNPSATWNLLEGVNASSTGAWAVGDYANSAGHYDTLILRWNGTTWSQVSSPNVGGASVLDSVAALSTGKAWAAGDFCAAGCGSLSSTTHTLILRWTGTRWSTVASPNPGAVSTYLNDLTAVSGTNAWAVGDYCASGCNTSTEIDDTMVLHWNGTAWSQATTPNPSTRANFLYGINAASATNAWAVGSDCRSACGTTGGGFFSGNFYPLILHWNGTAWTAS